MNTEWGWAVSDNDYYSIERERETEGTTYDVIDKAPH